MNHTVTAGQRRFQLCLISIAVFSVLFSVLFPYWAKRIMKPAREQERLQAPAQKGEALVAIYVPARDEEVTGRYYPAKVMVRFRDQILEPRDVRDAEKLHENQKLAITYRVGKSGRIYVDTAQAAAP
ncbi:MAG: hypothetical protein NT023_15450 [Armatimonadetes bacterium]|nr:hypothetical protein [Armatimonadota bacterium]